MSQKTSFYEVLAQDEADWDANFLNVKNQAEKWQNDLQSIIAEN